ncbi:hypothetical protein DV736_g2696, partial [Chaetothyriales sp. CBS 134916]
MAVQVVSDLHLEAPKSYDIFKISPKVPYLALLGDVGNIATHKDDYLAFLRQQLDQFRAVLFVSGNHEAYHSSWPDTLKILRTFELAMRKSDERSRDRWDTDQRTESHEQFETAWKVI